MKKRKLQMIKPMTQQQIDAFIAETETTPKPVQQQPLREVFGITG